MPKTGFEGSVLVLPETTTPTALADHGKIYFKSDNKMYAQDGAGTEVEVVGATTNLAEMQAQSLAQTIDTISVPHAVSGMSTGVVSGWTFDAGHTAAISAAADQGGGLVRFTATNTLAAGDWVTITGTTSYNGVEQVVAATGSNFDVTATFASNESGTFAQGSHLIAGTGSAGSYLMNWANTGVASGNDVFQMDCYVEGTSQPKGSAQRKFSTTDTGNFGATAILTIADDNVMWFAVTNTDGTSNITHAFFTVTLHRL